MTDYKRGVRRLSAGLVALAVVIRLTTAFGLDQRAGQAVRRLLSEPEFAGFLFYLELGQAGSWQTAGQPASAGTAKVKSNIFAVVPVIQPKKEAPAAEAPRERLEFTQADADAITIGGRSTYQADKLALLTAETALDFQQDGPTVLIVHTHTSEAYAQETGWEYDENDTARTQDPNYSVIRVGDELAETLEAHGIGVVHDTSFNDYPSYNGAYGRSLEKAEAWLAQYPSIQMVIDIHRDAAADADGAPVHYTADIGGEATAQLMLVIGTDEGGLSHPGWRDNLGWGLKLQAVLNRMYPGLCRSIDLRTERFNQHLTPGSLLVEVGASGNTLREALAAARDLGEGLAALIEGT